MRPGSRRFIGPLTPAQQRRRENARRRFRDAAEIADARCISMDAAFVALRQERWRRLICPAWALDAEI